MYFGQSNQKTEKKSILNVTIWYLIQITYVVNYIRKEIH